jgi:hypothetical protein
MRYTVSGLGVLTLAATVAAVLLWAFGERVGAAIVGTATVLLWLALIVVATVAVTAWWTRQTMRDGADIALKAQQINDAWDTRKTAALGALMREGAKIGRQVIIGRANPPALPMPDQGGDWLPDLVEFSLSDDNVIEVER